MERKEKEDNQGTVQEMLCCAQIPQGSGCAYERSLGKEQASRSVASALFDKGEVI